MKYPTIAASLILIAGLVSGGSALAQANDAKRDLALKIVALQQGADMDRMIGQLAASAVQPMVEVWARRVEANIPKSRQEQAGEQLKTELKRYGDDVYKLIQSKLPRVSQDSLVGAYMDSFSEDELRQLLAFFASPVVKKYQSLGPQLGNLVVQKLVEATRPEIQERARQFEAVALKIAGPDKSAK
jgi:hypothetical protein